MNKVLMPVLVLLILLIALAAPITINALALKHISVEAEPLPKYTSIVNEILTTNIGPGKPATVSPGNSIVIKLKNEGELSQTIICGVFVKGEKLEYREYQVSVEGSGKEYKITIPENTEYGLYDLKIVFNGETYVVPRSIWVVPRNLEEIVYTHLSDMHFGTGYPDKVIGGHKRFAGLVLSQLLGAQAIIVTGDEADTAAENEYLDSRAYHFMFQYSLPLLLVPGNHDFGTDNFEKFYGDREWYRVINGKILIVALYTRDEGLPLPSSLDWLENILKEYKEVPVKIIIMHHPVFYYQGTIEIEDIKEILLDPREYRESPISYYWGANLDLTARFLNIIEKYNVSIVHAGHIHRDQYVKLVFKKSGVTTYFISTTTAAHGRPNYDGIQAVRLYTNGSFEFPYAPPTFKGFADIDRSRVLNSIPVEQQMFPMIQPNGRFYGTFEQAKHAYHMTLLNELTYIDLENTVLLALPWSSGEPQLKLIDSKNGGSIELLDHLIKDGILYVLVKIKLPSNGGFIDFVIYNLVDEAPPKAKLSLTVPKNPIIGRTVKLYFKVYDEEWGLRNVTIYKVLEGEKKELSYTVASGGTYIVSDKIIGYDEPVEVTYTIVAYDIAGNKLEKDFTVTYYPKGWTPTTTSPSTSPTTLSPSPSPSPTTTTTPTTSPVQTPTPTPTQTSPKETPTPTPTTTTTTPQDYTRYLVVGLLLVILLVLAFLAFRRR